jgi:hypothetical protein
MTSVKAGKVRLDARHGSRYSGGMEVVGRGAPNEKTPLGCGAFSQRRLPESNRCKRLCRPLRSHSAKAPESKEPSDGPHCCPQTSKP